MTYPKPEPRVVIAGYDEETDVRLAVACERIADALERMIVLMQQPATRPMSPMSSRAGHPTAETGVDGS